MSEANALDRVLALAVIPELAELHPDDLASLAGRADEQRLAAGERCSPETEGSVCFLLEGSVAAGASRRGIEAPALLGVVEALAGSALELRALADGAQLLRVTREDLHHVTIDVFEVWLAMLRHTAARLLAAEPRLAEPPTVRRLVPADEPTSLITRILLLSGCELLHTLRAHALGRLASEMEVLQLPAHTVLWEPGASAAHAFVLIEGSLVSPSQGSAPERVAHEPGAVVGLRETLAGRPRASPLETASDTKLLRLASDTLVDELEDDPGMAAALLEALAQRVLRAESSREGQMQ